MPVTATTLLPDVSDLTLDATVEDQFTATWPDVTNYGEYDIEYREADVGDPFTSVATVGQDTTTQLITGLSDGEKYDVRVRSRTEHVTGDWYTVAQVSFLPVPDGFSLSNPAVDSLDAAWNDPVEGENGYRVYIAEEVDTNPQHGAGFGAYEEAADLAPGTTSTTLTDLQHNTTYRAYAEVYTEHVVASSGTDTLTTLVAYAATDWTTVLTDPTGDKLPLYPDVVGNIDLNRPHTALSDANISLPYQGAAMDYWEDATTVVEHFYAGERLFLGYLERVEHRAKEGRTMVEGRGVARDLLDIDLTVSFAGTPTWEAIQSVWGYAEFSTNVVPPDESQTVTDGVAQEADTTAEFASVWDPPADAPFAAQNGNLEQLKSAHFREGENRDRNGGTATFENGSEYSGGTTYGVGASGAYLEWDFTPEYDIPAERVGIKFRDHTPDAPAFTWTFNGNEIESITDAAGSLALSWTDAGSFDGNGYTGGDLTAGQTYTLRVESSTDGQYYVDCVCLYDTALEDQLTFDNSTDANDALAGPAPYPEVSAETVVSDATANVTDIAVNATFNNTADGVLALSVSNDGGTSYEPAAGATNTGTLDESMESVGTNIRAKLTTSGHGTQTSSPTQQVNPRILSAWTLTYDGTDLSVIDNATLTGDLLSIQQKLHKRAGYRFAVDHNADPVTIESFPTGQVVKSATWEVRDREIVTDLYDYANRVVVWGAEQEDGSRPKAVAKDATEIERLGGDPTADSGPGIRSNVIVDPDLGTLDAAKSMARTKLSAHVAERETTGTLEVWPTALLPGYSYPVDWHDDGTTTDTALERVSLEEEHANDRGTLKFDRDRGNSPAIVEARYAQANFNDLL